MKINIKIDTDDGEEEVVISNDEFANLNFIGVHINKASFDIAVDDLFYAVKAFKEIKDNEIIKERI